MHIIYILLCIAYSSVQAWKIRSNCITLERIHIQRDLHVFGLLNNNNEVRIDLPFKFVVYINFRVLRCMFFSVCGYEIY